jgi:cell division protease FtsH
VPFFSISGSDFVEMFVGVGASRVRDLFKQARDNSPCIIFLDEIDAVGRRRGSGMGVGHDEREQTLNAILVEMDGFGTDEGIIVIAATNRPDVLDPALLRPGRFDREVTIDLPDLQGREQILKVHLKKVKVGGDVDVTRLARGTPGYSGADLAAIINEAAIMAALQRRDEIYMEHLEEAREKVMFGRQKRSREMEEVDRKITAYHEAGHAVVGAMIPEVDPPTKVTIVPRGRALGLTSFMPEKEQYHMQRRRLVGQLAVGYGGRIAEAEFCGDISAGASNDIKQNTELARRMVAELGMSDKVGPVNYAERQGSEFLGTELMSSKWHSETTAREIDEEIQRFLREAYDRAEVLIRANRGAVESLATALMRYETITGDEVKEILRGASLDSLRPGVPHFVPRTPSARPDATKSPKPVTGGELPGTPGLSPA